MKKIILILTFLMASSATFANCKPQKLIVENEELSIEINYYKPQEKNGPRVLILPPIGGVSVLEEKYGKKICKKGSPAFVFYRWTGDDLTSVSDLTVHQTGTKNGIAMMELFFEKYPGNANIMGTSLGGIYTGLLAGRFEEIQKVVVIASGTNLAEILAYSELEQLVFLKKARYLEFGFSNDDEYADALRPMINLEAAEFENGLYGKRLLFFKATKDKVIAPKYQEELINLFDFDRREVVKMPFNHRNGIVATYLLKRGKIVRFLTSK